MNDRIHGLPDAYTSLIEQELLRLGRTLSRPKALAADVLKLSDHYNGNPDAKSPWDEPWAEAASLAYFFPLNYARARAVAAEALRLQFFSGLESIFDFGSGMGSAALGFRDVLSDAHEPCPELRAMDVSMDALALGRSLAAAYPERAKLIEASTPPRDLRKTLILASYAYTELDEIPAWWLEAEGLVIIEPSTQADGRRLMKLREELIARGHHVWAPCTHSGPCPLLHRSETDWCHDRVHFSGAGDWWPGLERELPMKNRTLTFSYLLARKTKAAPEALKGLTRVTGDRLEEKGKNRQSICRGPEREFLAWFPTRMKLKSGELEFGRGHLARLPDDLLKKGAENSLEARLQSPGELEVFPADQRL